MLIVFAILYLYEQYELVLASDDEVSKPDWPGGQNFGLGLGLGLDLDKLALTSALSIWPQSGLSLVNLISENVLFNAR